jgi:hypothetical protein
MVQNESENESSKIINNLVHSTSSITLNNSSNNDFEDTSAITSALKYYLKNLNEPLMTFAHNKSFLAACIKKNDNFKEGTSEIYRLIQMLPDVNIKVLEILMKHLYNVSKHSDTNKMNITNLATCFAPSLFRNRVEEEGAQNDIKYYVEIIEIMIANHDKIFRKNLHDLSDIVVVKQSSKLVTNSVLQTVPTSVNTNVTKSNINTNSNNSNFISNSTNSTLKTANKLKNKIRYNIIDHSANISNRLGGFFDLNSQQQQQNQTPSLNISKYSLSSSESSQSEENNNKDNSTNFSPQKGFQQETMYIDNPSTRFKNQENNMNYNTTLSYLPTPFLNANNSEINNYKLSSSSSSASSLNHNKQQTNTSNQTALDCLPKRDIVIDSNQHPITPERRHLNFIRKTNKIINNDASFNGYPTQSPKLIEGSPNCIALNSSLSNIDVNIYNNKPRY